MEASRVELCSKNKDKKSESNSQQYISELFLLDSCVRRTKIKNLKAIHNVFGGAADLGTLCSKNKDKKSESNSQRVVFIKIWLSRCVRRTKIKNLKAIHNVGHSLRFGDYVVFEEQR